MTQLAKPRCFTKERPAGDQAKRARRRTMDAVERANAAQANRETDAFRCWMLAICGFRLGRHKPAEKHSGNCAFIKSLLPNVNS